MKKLQSIRSLLGKSFFSPRQYFFIGLAVVFGFAVGAAFNSGKTDWAAWVQAVGSVIAIWVAIWITSQDNRRRNSDSLAIARLAASGLTMRLSANVGAVRQVKDRFQAWGEMDFDPNVLTQHIAILEKSGPWNIDELLPLIPLRGNVAYKLAGAFDRLHAAIFALRHFNDSNGMRDSSNRKEFIGRMGFLLGETCNLFDLAVTALQNESLSFTSPFHDGPDPSIRR